MLLAAVRQRDHLLCKCPCSYRSHISFVQLKDILSQRKGYVHIDSIKTIYVPQYKNLSIEKILAFAIERPQIEMYLPDEPDLAKVPKQWLVNICAAMIGDPFKDWVAE